MLVPWPMLSSLSSCNGSKTGSLHSPEAASPSDTLFPRSRISWFAMVCSCKAQDSQWPMARNDQVRSRMIPQQVLSPRTLVAIATRVDFSQNPGFHAPVAGLRRVGEKFESSFESAENSSSRVSSRRKPRVSSRFRVKIPYD
ncbi:hypothetical protein Ddc_17299 [Ditylenchus destructor]|nr:hypothetical protein Ddc_17299 [Ditylenchus destructor]